MLTGMISDEVYNNALSLAKESELNNDLNNLMVSLNGVNEVLKFDEEKIENEVSKDSNVENNIELNEKQLNEEDLQWLEGAMNIQNKNAFEKSEYEKMLASNNKLTNELNGIYVETETLNQARQEALNNFDIAEVVRIDNQLKNLQATYQNKLSEVNAFKNTVKSKQDDYTLKLTELEETLKDVNFKDKNININKEYYGSNVLNEFKNNKILDMVKSFLSNYSKQDGKVILQNSPQLISMLGENYNALLKDFN